MSPFLSKVTGAAYLSCDNTPHPWVRILVVLAVTLAACIGHAQPACPSVNFQGAASASLKPGLSTHMVVLRQSDGSYTAFELTDASPYRIVRTTENFQRQFSGCPGFPVVGTLPSTQPPEVFTRVESGGYLWVRRSDVNGPTGSYFALYVAAFDPALHLTSEAQYPVLIVEAMAVVDVNGDGIPDILIGTAFPHSAASEVLIWNGGSSFQPPVSYGIASSLNIRSIAVADLNGDHKLDAVISGSGKISAFLGNGDGPSRRNGRSSRVPRLAAGDCRPQWRWQARSGLH